jgi:hypothetical protein
MNKPLIAFLLLLITLIGCKKGPDFYPVSDEFKPWFLFQKGSYWIFRNDSTLDLDSVFHKAPPTYYNVPNSDETDIRQAISIQYQSSFFKHIDVLSNFSKQDFLSIEMYGSIKFLAMINNLPIHGTRDGSHGPGYTHFVYIDHFSDFELNNNSFYDVC